MYNVLINLIEYNKGLELTKQREAKQMKNLSIVFLGVLLLLVLSACGQVETIRETQVIDRPVIVPNEPIDELQAIIDDENTYRLGLGQTMLSNGLSCTLYTFTSGDRIQASIAGHNTFSGLSQVATFLYSGPFNQPDSPSSNGLNVLPMPLRAMYLNMFLVRCQGQLVVVESGLYGFELASDDASLLYIDGVKVIDNDNNHGITKVIGNKYLRKGVHSFRIDYAQAGAGNQALILTSNNQTIDGELYLH